MSCLRFRPQTAISTIRICNGDLSKRRRSGAIRRLQFQSLQVFESNHRAEREHFEVGNVDPNVEVPPKMACGATDPGWTYHLQWAIKKMYLVILMWIISWIFKIFRFFRWDTSEEEFLHNLTKVKLLRYQSCSTMKWRLCRSKMMASYLTNLHWGSWL